MLAARGNRTDLVLGWLEEHGGYRDYEVASNAGDHWRDNRLGAHQGEEPDPDGAPTHYRPIQRC
jgi:hypothetical protein